MIFTLQTCKGFINRVLKKTLALLVYRLKISILISVKFLF